MSVNLPEERIERITNVINTIKPEDGLNKSVLLAKLKSATFDETNLLDDLFSMIDASVPKNAAQIFRGAHVCIKDDNGQYFLFWRLLGSANERPSSHASDREQYEVAGPFCHTILFSVLNGHTWFQMENHSYFDNLAAHGWDYAHYLGSKENQGPYGSSTYTEAHPLEIHSMTDND